MKLKFYTTVLLIGAFQFSQAQDRKGQEQAKNLQKKDIIAGETSKKNLEQAILSEKEWESIMKKIEKNKKKHSKQKYLRAVSKIVDTVYIEMPALKSDTRLSDW